MISALLVGEKRTELNIGLLETLGDNTGERRVISDLSEELTI